MIRPFWVAVAAYAVAWLVAALTLPDRVPMHFDLAGEPDRWAARSAALLTFGLLGGASASLLGWLTHRVPRGDLRHVNVPHKQWWLTHRPEELRSLLAQDLELIATATMGLLTVVLAAVVAGARAEEPALPVWATVAVIAYVVGLLAWAAYVMLVRYRPPNP